MFRKGTYAKSLKFSASRYSRLRALSCVRILTRQLFGKKNVRSLSYVGIRSLDLRRFLFHYFSILNRTRRKATLFRREANVRSVFNSRAAGVCSLNIRLCCFFREFFLRRMRGILDGVLIECLEAANGSSAVV